MTTPAPPRAREHVVSIVIGGKEIRGFIDYQVDVGMLEPADSFSLTAPASRELWTLVARGDRKTRILIDGVSRVDGYVDEPEFGAVADTIKISGRCKVGRLVQTSAPAFDYRGMKLSQLALKLASPEFKRVTLSNARNRRLMRGHGKKVASADTLFIDSQAGHRLEPGQMRWAILEELCKEFGAIVWSSADGAELVIGQPNYKQEIQHRFFHPAPGSSRMAEGNIADLTFRPSTGDRYARIMLLGAGAGAGRAAASRVGDVKDGPNADGTGRDFRDPKLLVLADQSVKDQKTARALAFREQARRDMRRDPVTVVAFGHGQVVGGRQPTLYTPDTLAYVEDERTGKKGTYLIVSCSYKASRGDGETTTLEMVPRGQVLAA